MAKRDLNTDPEFQAMLRERLTEMGFDYSKPFPKKGVKGAWKGYKPKWQYKPQFHVYWETAEKPNGIGKKYKHFRDALKWMKRMDEAGYFNIHVSYLDAYNTGEPWWWQYHEGMGVYGPKIYVPHNDTGEFVMYDVFKAEEARCERLRRSKLS